MDLEDLGVIGNCQYSATIRNTGEVVWCCIPRFDSDPVFSTLLDSADGGKFVISPADGGEGVQSYIENTNILRTVFDTPTGRFQVIDFAPRFVQHAQTFHAYAPFSDHRADRGDSTGASAVRSEVRMDEAHAGSDERIEPHSFRRIRQRLAVDVRCPRVVHDGAAVYADGPTALGADVWGADRRAARAAGYSLFERDARLLGSLGEAVQHSAVVPGGGDSFGADAEAALL